MWVWFLDWEDPLEEGMATHSNILAWRIPWTEEPGGLWSRGSQRVRRDWSDLVHSTAVVGRVILSFSLHPDSPHPTPDIHVLIPYIAKGIVQMGLRKGPWGGEALLDYPGGSDKKSQKEIQMLHRWTISQGLWAAPRCWKRQRKGLPWSFQKEHNPAKNLDFSLRQPILDFWSPELQYKTSVYNVIYILLQYKTLEE